MDLFARRNVAHLLTYYRLQGLIKPRMPQPQFKGSYAKGRESRGKRNWLKLKNIILGGTLGTKRKDKKFNLFQKDCRYAEDHILTSYAYQKFTIWQKSPTPTYKKMLHFEGEVDATGRWVWEAEEVAAFFFLNYGESIARDFMESKSGHESISVLELGAGSSGLAGIALSQLIGSRSKGQQVHLELTDGEGDNICYLQQNLQLNSGYNCKSRARKLVWGDEETVANLSRPEELRQTFDVIVVCDCLYFCDVHKQLVMTLQSYLSRRGSVYLINPSRGGSMALFLAAAGAGGFISEVIQFKNEKFESEAMALRKDKDFIEDKHFPFFLKLSKVSP